MDWLAELPVGTGPDSIRLRIHLCPRPRDGPVLYGEVNWVVGGVPRLSRNQLRDSRSRWLRVPMGESTLGHV